MPASVSTPSNTPASVHFGGRASEVSLCVKVFRALVAFSTLVPFATRNAKSILVRFVALSVKGAYHQLLCELLFSQDMKLGQQTR